MTNLRQYRAIRAALTQGDPVEPQGQCARHLNTLVALFGARVEQVQECIAPGAQVVALGEDACDGRTLSYTPHPYACEGTEIWEYYLLCAQMSGTMSTQVLICLYTGDKKHAIREQEATHGHSRGKRGISPTHVARQ